MPKISKKASVMLSIILASAFIAVIIVLAVAMPFAASGVMRDYLNEVASEKLGEENVVAAFIVWGYCVLADALVCCVAVLFLLIRVRRGLVFTEISVSLNRFISWCCLILAAIILFAQLFHPTAFIFALAAAFLGLCLRVVKNVIEAATAIKNENDLTV